MGDRCGGILAELLGRREERADRLWALFPREVKWSGGNTKSEISKVMQHNRGKNSLVAYSIVELGRALSADGSQTR